jgi:hypothetical protein
MKRTAGVLLAVPVILSGASCTTLEDLSPEAQAVTRCVQDAIQRTGRAQDLTTRVRIGFRDRDVIIRFSYVYEDGERAEHWLELWPDMQHDGVTPYFNATLNRGLADMLEDACRLQEGVFVIEAQLLRYDNPSRTCAVIS